MHNAIKNYSVIFFTVLLSCTLMSLADDKADVSCYISFKNATGLTTGEPDRLPETADKNRAVNTDNGEVEVSRTDGYRILYNNDKGVPFVNLKVEISQPGQYESDMEKLIANIKYLASRGINMESKELIELKFNGYKVYGLSRSSIEAGSTLGTFIMFPGNGIVVYFYFNNLKPEYRNFNSVEDYKRQRDLFMQEYTAYVRSCRDK